jgi:hypothetical protein
MNQASKERYVLKGTMMREGCIVLRTEIDGRLKLSSGFFLFWCNAELPRLVSFVKQVM